MTAQRPVCPECGERSLIRIHRRMIDRLLGIFVKVHRYRCEEFPCRWEGRLKVPKVSG
ncbi:MAG: hypothetical protein H6R15_3088 [Proteobacteria bacterium]|nr:hypothetical protein [Pseudomonadota bacterium]